MNEEKLEQELRDYFRSEMITIEPPSDWWDRAISHLPEREIPSQEDLLRLAASFLDSHTNCCDPSSSYTDTTVEFYSWPSSRTGEDAGCYGKLAIISDFSRRNNDRSRPGSKRDKSRNGVCCS